MTLCVNVEMVGHKLPSRSSIFEKDVLFEKNSSHTKGFIQNLQ